MAIRLGDVFVAIRGDDSRLRSDFHNAERQVTGFASGLGNRVNDVVRGAFERVGQFATNAVIAGARAAFDFAQDSVKAASDLNESISKVNVVFGDSANEIRAWADTAATAFGQSEQQALEAAGTFGNLFSALGFGKDIAKDMSIGLVELASDLASFNNIGVDEALIKLRAGIVGETEPLRTLGVNLSAVQVEAKALELGLAATKKEITETDKVTARYAIIMEQTALAQGDFARTSNGLANSQRILAAQMTDLKATVGTALLPIITEMVGIMSRLTIAVMPSLANFIDQNVTPAMQGLADALERLVLNSAFEWTPTFKQIKIGDLFEFASADGLGGLTRIKVKDLFDLTWNADGLQKLTIGDFFDFVSEGGATQLNISDYITFVKDEGVTSFTIKDFIDFLDTPTRTQINLGDYISFIYDKPSGAIALEIEDVFSFNSSAAGITFNLADYVTFLYDSESGKITLTVADVFTFESGPEGLTFNLADYISFIYESASGAYALNILDVFTLVSDEGGTLINLADYIKVVYDNKGNPLTIRLGELYRLETEGDTQKIDVGNFLEITGSPKETVTRLELADLLAFTAPATYSDLVALTTLPAITKIVFSDIFGFGGEDKVTQDDLFDLNQKQQPPKYTLNDFIDWATQGKEVTKFTVDDFFDFTADKRAGIIKLTIGDFVVFNNGETAKFSYGDVFSFSKDTAGITKLELGDFINLEGKGVSGLFADALSDASTGLGKKLEEMAHNLGENLNAPDWVQALIDWKPADGAPDWVTNLFAWKWPDAPATVGDLVKWVWPDAPGAITDLLAWEWPEFGAILAATVAAVIGFTWPEFGAGLTAIINAIIAFKWPELKAPAWLSQLTNFNIPAPGWLQSLLNWAPPSIVPSGGGSGGGSGGFGGDEPSGRSLRNTAPVTVNVGPNYIRDTVDVELLTKRIAQQLAGI